MSFQESFYNIKEVGVENYNYINRQGVSLENSLKTTSNPLSTLPPPQIPPPSSQPKRSFFSTPSDIKKDSDELVTIIEMKQELEEQKQELEKQKKKLEKEKGRLEENKKILEKGLYAHKIPELEEMRNIKIDERNEMLKKTEREDLTLQEINTNYCGGCRGGKYANEYKYGSRYWQEDILPILKATNEQNFKFYDLGIESPQENTVCAYYLYFEDKTEKETFLKLEEEISELQAQTYYIKDIHENIIPSQDKIQREEDELTKKIEEVDGSIKQLEAEINKRKKNFEKNHSLTAAAIRNLETSFFAKCYLSIIGF